MKKHKLIITLVAIIVFSFIGCESIHSTEIEGSYSENIILEDNQNEYDFYGVWSIERLIYCNDENKQVQDDIESVVGKTIEFYETQVVLENVTYNNPTYTEKDLSEEEFSTEEGMTFSSLDISGDTIKQVKLDNYAGDIGGVFYIKDASTLIIVYAGSYLEATKVN